MYLEKICTENFRNIQTHEIKFSKGVNLLSGNNGQGKTNLLEAIYFLSNLKSFRKAKRNNLATWGTTRFGLRGNFIDEESGEGTSLEVVCDQGKSQYRIDGEQVNRVESYLSQLAVMAFHPDSLSVLKGGPVFRRMFIDRGLFCENRKHLALLKNYNQVVAERRWILKNGKLSLLEVWDEKLVDLGVKLTMARHSYCQRLNGEVKKVKPPPGEVDLVRLVYRSSIKNGLEEGEVVEEDLRMSFVGRLKKMAQEEQRRGTTLVGPHRDEFEIFTGEKELSNFGSQGQQRGALLCLMMAQAILANGGEAGFPLLIFDDVMSELDEGRMEWVQNVLQNMRNQVFLSALRPLYVRNHFGTIRRFTVHQGEIDPVSVAA
jgi:DNA replication and repair protein RecF